MQRRATFARQRCDTSQKVYTMISIFNGRSRGLGADANDTVYIQTSVEMRQYLYLFKGAPLAIFQCIALHANADGWAWPSLKTIARETGYNTQTISDAITSLRSLSINGDRVMMAVQDRKPNGGFERNKYLLFPSKAEVIQYEPSVGFIHTGYAHPYVCLPYTVEPSTAEPYTVNLQTEEEPPLTITNHKEEPPPTRVGGGDGSFGHFGKNEGNDEESPLISAAPPQTTEIAQLLASYGVSAVAEFAALDYDAVQKRLNQLGEKATPGMIVANLRRNPPTAARPPTTHKNTIDENERRYFLALDKAEQHAIITNAPRFAQLMNSAQ